jgi:outer membrane lipoprotein
MRAVFSVVLVLLSAACATSLPEPIRVPPSIDLSLAAAREMPEAHTGQRVRWGGRIASVENRAAETWVDIVARELDSNGRPRDTDQSLGRYIARVPGFLDPAVYSASRDVTVAGAIDGVIVRNIGEYAYRYVLVKADTIHLWEPRVVRRDVYRAPYYDPFWHDPFWPWRPYPYAPYSYW